MLKMYTSYVCKTCNKDFILFSEDVDSMTKGRYLSCPYCNSKRIVKGVATDNLKDFMKHSSYKRIRGALHQK